MEDNKKVLWTWPLDVVVERNHWQPVGAFNNDESVSSIVTIAGPLRRYTNHWFDARVWFMRNTIANPLDHLTHIVLSIYTLRSQLTAKSIGLA